MYMRKTTNLFEIKSIAKSFVYLDIDKNSEFYPIFIQHPIFESAFQSVNINGQYKIINITESEDDLKIVREYFEECIDKCQNVIDVYMIIRKSYKLTFIKFIKPYLNMKDFCNLLSDAWITSENPNGDINVSTNLAVKWFKQADKQILMNKEEYQVYLSFPDYLTVYRGVAINRNQYGLSWTTDYEKAKWFAHRFDTDEKGYVLKATISKENILAYFNSREEFEVVVNIFDLNKKEIEQLLI